jgi:hypothetical protein
MNDCLPHKRIENVLSALMVAGAMFLGIGALAAAMSGCAVAAGAAAGGAAGYVAGHEAGEDEAHEEMHEIDADHHHDD